MSEPVKCGWCGLVDPSPHSEVIHRGTLECVDTQACANRLAEAEKTALERERDDAREELAAVMSVATGYEESNRRLRAEVEMHKGLRAETLKANENLRAEVRDLKARLKAARLAMDVDAPVNHGAGFCDSMNVCPVCIGYLATDLRRKNWRKP